MSQSLFERVIAASGLSPLFAAMAIRTACQRAGVDADHLGPKELNLALPLIQKTMAIYLPPDEVETNMVKLRALAS